MDSGENEVLIINEGTKPETIRADDQISTLSSLVSFTRPDLIGDVSVAGFSLGREDNGTTQCLALLDLVKLDNHRACDERDAVMGLLESHKEVFGSGNQDIGRLGIAEHLIDLLDHTPIYQKQRSLPEPINE